MIIIEKIFVSPDINSLLLVIALLLGVFILRKLVSSFILFCEAEQNMLKSFSNSHKDTSLENDSGESGNKEKRNG